MKFNDENYRYGGTLVNRKVSGLMITSFPTTELNTTPGK